ncbi:MAG: AhpC/TSA family protein [Chitinophagaceae bacterium]|nr:AhpC/TSA family protein [Chitinophagaceae bacterium]
MKAIRNSLLLPLLLIMFNAFAQKRTVIRFASSKIPDGTKLTLRKEWPVRQLVDTALIRGGQWEFVVTDDYPAVYTLTARKPWMNAVVFLEGEDVKVEFNQEEPVVTGSKAQKAYADFLASIKPYEEQWRDIGNRYGAAKDMEEKLKISREMDAPAEKVMGGRDRFVTEHANDLAGIWMAHDQLNLWREPALKKMIPLFSKQENTRALAKQLQQKLDAIESKKMTGNKAPAFALNDIRGNSVSLDSVLKRNEYVLVDIWASWCTPCRATNRKLAPEYASLKKLGIELISVSVDEKLADWQKAVAVDKIPWTQLVSPEGMKSKLVQDYKVESLPATFLIDKNGNIIRQHVSIEELKQIATP